MKVLVLGRSQNNDITFNDPYVSRVHAQLVFHDDGRVSVVDLGSKTGTIVNGTKIQSEYFLNPNDILRIGNTVVPWTNYASTQINSAEAYQDDDAEDFLEEEVVQTSFFNKHKNKLLIGLLSLLILGGAAYWLKQNNKWPFYKEAKKTVEIKENKKEENNDIVVKGDGYYYTLPEGFEKDEDNEDSNVEKYKDKNNKIYFSLEATNKESFKKKNKRVKDKDLLEKFKKLDLKSFPKKEKLNNLKIDKGGKVDINDLDAITIKFTTTSKEDKDKKIYGERTYIEGEDNFYVLYLYTTKTKPKKLKSNKKIMQKILKSFNEGEREDDASDDENSDDKDKKESDDDEDDE